MTNKTQLRTHQLEILETLNSRVNLKQKQTIISMVPGSGKTLLIGVFLKDYLESQKQKARVLIICDSLLVRAQTILILSEELSEKVGTLSDIRSSRVIAAHAAELRDRLETSNRKNAFDLVIFLDTKYSAYQKFNENNGQKAWFEIIFTGPAEQNGIFGELNYRYTFKDAIGDGIYCPYTLISVNLEMNDEEQLAHELFLRLAQHEPKKTSSPSILESEGYLKILCNDIVTRSRAEKTLILAPNIQTAERISELLNNIHSSETFATSIHTGKKRESINGIIDDFDNPTSALRILIVVGLIPLISRIRTTRNLIPLRKSASTLLSVLGYSLRRFQGKESVTVFDYIGVRKLLNDPELDGLPIEDDIEVIDAKKLLAEAHYISFRDKKNIDPVLAVDELAEELSDIIKVIPGEQGAMIGIFGNWGRGKTFLMDIVWKKLVEDQSFHRIDFHAWRYQDTPATWAYLYELLAEAYFDHGEKKWYKPKWITSYFNRLKLNLIREKFLTVVKLVGTIAFGVILIPAVKLYLKSDNDLLNFFRWPASFSVFAYTAWKSLEKDYSAKAKDVFSKYFLKHSFKDHLGLQAEIQQETQKLVKCWIPKKDLGKKRLILFVDDIDRCNELKVIQIIDSLRVLLEDHEIAERVVILAAIDERFLKLAIKTKYTQLLSVEKKDAEQTATDLNRVTDEYMDKLFISGIRLGNLSRLDRDDFMLSLTKPDRSSDAVLKSLEEIISDEQRTIDSRMTPFLQDILLQDDIERSYDQQQYDEGLMEGTIDEEYYPEYLEPSEPISIDQPIRTKEKLSEDEVAILRYATIWFEDATPRQIRIFYYRYLMAKNLLDRRYRALARNNTWKNPRHSAILARLIIHYTNQNSNVNKNREPEGKQSKQQVSLQERLKAAMKSNTEKMSVDPLHKVLMPTQDYLLMLKVLDTVIAY
ncbi:P-loop NTPase fold protein [Pedobacter soli]|uniref:Superfamily II DNA or RNA helicase n=1 Tax=Pedobacter soli TaxID=390242 RepID=A0A1G6K643_9SPHI|nr:P-loop NTPase fold protein [Pedobacter soli]SDC25776.1 Superfamily II DNA or RNA helicase [Pedobacter soli]